MLLREIFIGGARAPPAPPHATALDLQPLETFPLKFGQRIACNGPSPPISNTQ